MTIAGSGKRGQVLKGDVLEAIAKAPEPAQAQRRLPGPLRARSSARAASRFRADRP